MDSTSIHDFFVFGRGSHRRAFVRAGAWLGCSVSFAQVRELASWTSLAAWRLIQGIQIHLESRHFSLVLEAFAHCKTPNASLVASLVRLPLQLGPTVTGERQRA